MTIDDNDDDAAADAAAATPAVGDEEDVIEVALALVVAVVDNLPTIEIEDDEVDLMPPLLIGSTGDMWRGKARFSSKCFMLLN